MSQVRLAVQVPDELLRLLDHSRLSKLDRSSQIRVALALHFFMTGQISIGKAAELSGQERLAFENFLRELDLPVVTYGQEELKVDQQTSDLLRERPSGA
jgi:predicted HTH domain antitoxin